MKNEKKRASFFFFAGEEGALFELFVIELALDS